MLILIDNYDSFTYNLVHYLGELGAESVVIRNDKVTAEEVMAQEAEGDRAVARPVHAQRSRRLPRSDQEGRRRPFRCSASASAISRSASPTAAR